MIVFERTVGGVEVRAGITDDGRLEIILRDEFDMIDITLETGDARQLARLLHEEIIVKRMQN